MGSLPFSGAVVADSLVFISGQVAIDPRTGVLLSRDIRGQTLASLRNLEALLRKAACGKPDIVKTTVFLRDISDYVAMNEEYRRFFHPNFPARSTVQALLFRPEVLVEIEAIAVRKSPPATSSRERVRTTHAPSKAPAGVRSKRTGRRH